MRQQQTSLEVPPIAMFKFAFVLLFVPSLVTAVDVLLNEEENQCTKYFLPEDQVEVRRHVNAIVKESDVTPLNVSTTFCTKESDQPESEFSLLKEVLKEIEKDREERKIERKIERNERRREITNTLKTMSLILSSNFGFKDCYDHLEKGERESDIYPIFPIRGGLPVSVYCDMESNQGGWTVFLARQTQAEQLNFNRSWTEYRDGFGTPDSEYWLGNEILHQLTKNRDYKVRLEAMDLNGEVVWGEWNIFKVDSESNKYRLTVENYSEESTSHHGQLSNANSMPFSTFDRLNDPSDDHLCPKHYESGWWYSNCFLTHPTGAHGVANWKGIVFIRSWSKEDAVNDHYAQLLSLKIKPVNV